MSFPYAARRARLRALIAAADADAALVTTLVNVRYLTGLASSNAALLVPAGDRPPVLATDARYAPAAAQHVPDLELLTERKTGPVLAERAVRDGVRRLAVETHTVTVDAHATLQEAADGAALVPLGRVVEGLRAVKDAAELDAVRRACAASDAALAGLVSGPVAGRSERDLARDLESRMLDAGADAPAFVSIVAAGPHSAVPHHAATDRLAAPGDLLKLDFGARWAGYAADMTRTFVVGGPGRAAPAGWQTELHALVAAAAQAGRAALRAGADVRDVDDAARSVVVAAGYGEQFPHGLGHGVGLEVHEAPMMGYSATGTLPDSSPVTVEPGVYLAGRGGVRIEDLCLVRDGTPELLTTAARELLVLT